MTSVEFYLIVIIYIYIYIYTVIYIYIYIYIYIWQCVRGVCVCEREIERGSLYCYKPWVGTCKDWRNPVFQMREGPRYFHVCWSGKSTFNIHFLAATIAAIKQAMIVCLSVFHYFSLSLSLFICIYIWHSLRKKLTYQGYQSAPPSQTQNVTVC